MDLILWFSCVVDVLWCEVIMGLAFLISIYRGKWLELSGFECTTGLYLFPKVFLNRLDCSSLSKVHSGSMVSRLCDVQWYSLCFLVL